ncbi:MAG: CPBP family intramembrane metalloprotease [Candidatus Zixiibacteriota bacterium]|nr:MAG: CPBP family intramembrane metalloprotease [candidate division Zixibacteria bacterium]
MKHQPTFKRRNPSLVLVWTFGLFLLMHLNQYAGVLLGSALSGAGFESIISGEFSDHRTLLAKGLVGAILGIPLSFLVIKYLWRRSWDWLCFRWRPGLLLGGVLAGCALSAVVVGVTYLFDAVKFTQAPGRLTTNQLVSLLFGHAGWALFVAVAEESVFRGMAVREWASRWGWAVAIVLGGVFFGVVHLMGLLPHLSVEDAAWVVFCGILVNWLFVALYIRSRSLWLPIGFHAGWNFSLKALFGTTVSGKTSTMALYNSELSGPESLTGGQFGIEASWVSLIVYILAAVLVLYYPRSGTVQLLHPRPQNSDREDQAA